MNRMHQSISSFFEARPQIHLEDLISYDLE
jgi:hypothetical protein